LAIVTGPPDIQLVLNLITFQHESWLHSFLSALLFTHHRFEP
jgi:hypothetical protein